MSHKSAGDAWGLRQYGGSRVHVTVTTGAGRRHRGIAIHRSRSLPPEEVTTTRAIPVTTPARTLLDLAAVVPNDQLGRAVERAEALGLFDLRAVEAVLARHPRRAGRRALADVLERWAPIAVTRSELEECFLGLCAASGLPRPQVNARVGPYEVDFLWPRTRVIVETDGHAFHGTRIAFERDRARDARLSAAGYRVVRFTYRQVVREPAFVASVLCSLLGGE